MKRVFITGGTGVLGRRLAARLLERGDQPVILSRRCDEVRRDRSTRGFGFVQGDPTEPGPWQFELGDCDAVVNLAGHNLFAERWNGRVRRLIRDSRVRSAENVADAFEKAEKKPGVLVQASAIGFYGAHGDEELTEESPSGTDYSGRLCREWESAAAGVSETGARLATVRIGIVLSKNEGALGVMTPVFKWLPGGAAPVGGGDGPLAIGNGKQWFSWIHLDDIVGILLLALDHPQASGPINGVSPNPVRNSEFAQALAKALKRPYLPFGPPEAILRVLLGDVAEVITTGQKVLPTKAQSLGYVFKYSTVAAALAKIFEKPAPPPPKPKPAAHAHGHAAAHH